MLMQRQTDIDFEKCDARHTASLRMSHRTHLALASDKTDAML